MVDRSIRALARFPIFGALIVLAMGVLVIYPIGRMLYFTFVTNGTLSGAPIQATFSDPGLRPALFNTAWLLIAGGGCALVLGACMAWLNERTDAQLGWAADILPVIPLLAPTLAVAIGWTFLLAPGAGILNVFVRHVFQGPSSVFGRGPMDIYTAGGMFFVTVILTVPYAYLIVAAALKNVDPALEEASRMSGYGPARTLIRITFPSIRNALATASVVLVITIVAMFSVGFVLGSPAHISVLSVYIYTVVFLDSPPHLGEAIVLSSFLMTAVQLAVLLEYAITRSGHHATVGGRSHTHSQVRLGAWRWPVRVGMALYLASVTVLPLLGLLLVSLQRFWSAQIAWGRLSFANYVALLEPAQASATTGALRQALLNSLWLAVATASALMVLATLLAFFVQSRSGLIARIANFFATLPASMPHIVVAIGFLIAFGVGKVSIAGTTLLLFLAYVVLSLPIASRSAGTALSQIGKDLWESSLMSGASSFRTLMRILLPLMLSGLIAGWVIVFAHTVTETSAGVFLSGATNPVVGPIILLEFQGAIGTYPQLAALATLITVFQAGVVVVVLGWVRRRQRYRRA